jgi:DNA polymerase III epsilon subunit-like protein
MGWLRLDWQDCMAIGQHVMVDLETMGTEPTAALVSIAAVLFDPRGSGISDSFHTNIDLQSCLNAGLRVNAGTVYWWLTRSEAARSALLKDRVSLSDALKCFSLWFRKTAASRIWSHGATFDIVALEAAYRAVGGDCPYNFRDARDTRTLFELAGVEYSHDESTAHQALHDAQRQAQFVQQAYRVLIGAGLMLKSEQAD